MLKAVFITTLLAVAIAFAAAGLFDSQAASKASEAISPRPTPTKTDAPVVFVSDWDGTEIERTEAEWRSMLTEFRYYILREKGTENPYTGKLTANKQKGTYHCAACGLALFSSEHKYDSKTGWPSFYQPINGRNIREVEDLSIPEEPRTEIICARCGSHQGHVFDDGPEPTGLRYCINSAALRFAKAR